MREILYFILIFFLSSCYSNRSEINERANDILNENRNSLMSIVRMIDTLNVDSCTNYNIFTTINGMFIFKEVERNSQGEIIDGKSFKGNIEKVKDQIDSLLPKKHTEILGFKRGSYVFFTLRDIRNSSFNYAKLIYINDTSKVNKMFPRVKKYNLESKKTDKSKFKDVITFIDKNWGIVDVDSLLTHSNVFCK